jgi:hypothetical protein
MSIALYNESIAIPHNQRQMNRPIITGYQLHHNYFRQHERLNGKTPADIAGIKIEGENKWITVIQNAVDSSN